MQRACQSHHLPRKKQVRKWVRAAAVRLPRHGGTLTVRFVDGDEAQRLNGEYRAKHYATNVLSFAYRQWPLLDGDLVVCAPVAESEAVAQGKTVEAHYAHLIVHGALHLQGYDHEADEQAAEEMETLERRILAALGYPDPYAALAGKPAPDC